MATDKNKQKKQLIALVVLLIALGGFALYQFDVFSGSPEPAPAPAPTPAETASAEPTAPPAPTGTAATTVDKDLEVPDPFAFSPKVHQWPAEVGVSRGGRGWAPGDEELWPFDPLRVKNVDIVNPELRRYIEEVKKNWVVVGITRTWQLVTEKVPVTAEDSEGKDEGNGVDATPEDGEEAQPQDTPADPGPEGQPDDPNAEEPEQEYVEVQRWRLVTEVWFENWRAPFRRNDRLTGTRFVIADIVFGRDRKDPNLTPRALVRLRGDSGEQLDLELAPAGRYGEDDAPRGGR